MEFATPQALLWLWLAVVVLIFHVWGVKQRFTRLRKLLGVWRRNNLFLSPRRGRHVTKGLLLVSACISLIFAAAQPRWGFEWQTIKTSGSDVMIAVDVSTSMLAEDLSPSRLLRAKREIIDFLNLAQGDRVGLIAFAGGAFVQCPLTIDYNAVRMFLDYLDPSLIPVQGTAIGEAIQLATASLVEASPQFSKGRALILITDGEDHDERTDAALVEAKKQGVKVFTIGIGSSEGAPVPESEGGFKKDASGKVILSRLNESMLQDIATQTNGVFVRSISGDMDLERIYYDGIRGGVDEQEFGEEKRRIWYERFQIFALLGFLLLLWEGCFSDFSRWSIRGGVTLLVVVGSLSFADLSVAQGIRGAEKAFRQGEFDKAERAFGALEIDDPDDPRHAYNRGVSSYRQGDYGAAAEAFKKSASDMVDGLAKDNAQFNLGNAYAKGGEYDDAIATYQELLRRNPDDERVKQNLSYVEELKKLQQQQQSNQNQNKDQDDQQSGRQQNSQNGDLNAQQQSSQDRTQSQSQQGSNDNDSASQSTSQAADGSKRQTDEQNAETAGHQEQSQQLPKKATDGEKNASRPGKKLSRREAERLLRGVKDRGAKVLQQMMRNEMENEGLKPQQGKDW